ncbi:S-adenosyl-L-methionine-dependent methyltransferase [Aspergillus caelatus]|uniref:S-adenosyl-L-methionine-dependent methyltransferase n=1 Tax=Aspergillus caelatus TaxID=61420 RepID=A0A5N7AN95_9EURO|nr:S-adenosyl-L-methionine-dependent methyltransferase [Aspergillus caelatus]KAE8370459.1 S-adenosyl-L-methionine-dependent methyltransferase [Aspergillus caelatus]
MEIPVDSIHRIAYAPLQVGLAQVGVDLRLFEMIRDSVSSHAELATKAKVDPVLMRRLLRYYQSVGMISQLDTDTFVANNVTNALASDMGRSGIYMQADVLGRSMLAFPQFLRSTNYRNPSNPYETAFHLGMQTDQDLFKWLESHPNYSVNFNTWMSTQRETKPIFLDVLDFPSEIGPSDESTVLFVDIGGSRGHQSIALRQRYPDLLGRVIVQDIPHVVAEVTANPLPGFESIEIMEHNMFTPQPLKSARAYYFRSVFHDWPDDKCREILENLKVGMTGESLLLLDEMVVSERDAPWRATLADMTMAVALSAMERTEAEWRALLDAAGLRMVKVLKYRAELEDCVMVCALK